MPSWPPRLSIVFESPGRSLAARLRGFVDDSGRRQPAQPVHLFPGFEDRSHGGYLGTSECQNQPVERCSIHWRIRGNSRLGSHIPGAVGLSRVELNEKRKLSAAPTWPSNPKEWEAFPHAFDEYANDHFGWRNELITLNSYLRYRFGVSASPKILVGNNCAILC